MTNKETAGHVRSLAATAAALTLAAALAGCSTLGPALTHSLEQAAPDQVGIVLDHTSHILQHAPFAGLIDTEPTNYGYDDIGLALRWQSGPLWLELDDGYELLSGWQSLPGPREVFHAQMGIALYRKGN